MGKIKSIFYSSFLKTDNNTVVAYVNRTGGTKSPVVSQRARELWQWCLSRKIKLKTQHLPGARNVRADFLSRHLRDGTDWILDAGSFDRINSRLGPLEVGGGYRCLYSGLEKDQGIHESSMVSDCEGAAEDTTSDGNSGDRGNTLAKSGTVPPAGGNVGEFSTPNTTGPFGHVLLPNCDSPIQPQLIACKASGCAYS